VLLALRSIAGAAVAAAGELERCGIWALLVLGSNRRREKWRNNNWEAVGGV
jgi:hypothetical protein